MANANLTKEDLRTVLRYEFDRGSSAPKALESINETYGDGTISRATVFRWYEKFNSGETSREDAPRSGQPAEFDEDELEQLLEEDNRQTQSELAEQMGCSQQTISYHLKKMGKIQKYGALWPSDYHLFRALANALMGLTFEDEEELESWLDEWIAGKCADFFKRGIDKLPERWQEVINSGGECIED